MKKFLLGWSIKIAKSSETPLAIFVDSGGCKVQLVLSTNLLLINSNVRERGRSQNLILFIRGNAISASPPFLLDYNRYYYKENCNKCMSGYDNIINFIISN